MDADFFDYGELLKKAKVRVRKQNELVSSLLLKIKKKSA